MGNDKDLHRNSSLTPGGDGSVDESPTRGASPSGQVAPDAPHIEIQPPPTSVPAGSSSEVAIASSRQNWITRIFPGRSRRDLQLQTLQSGYVEMLDLMRSISSHLDRQAQSQTRLLRSLERFPEAVDGLKNVGKATEQQTEVLKLVRDQLESTAQHEQDMVGSMEGFNRTLHLMDETNRATSSTVSDLVDRSHTAESELRTMLERSQQRLTLLSGVLGTVGLVVVAGVIYFSLAQDGNLRTTTVEAPPDDATALAQDDTPPVEAPAGDLVAETVDGEPVMPFGGPVDIVEVEVLSAEMPDASATDAETTTIEEPQVEPAPGEVVPDGPQDEPVPESPPSPGDGIEGAAGPDTAQVEADDQDDEIVGIRTVFRRVFSFIGDEDEASDPASEAVIVETASASAAPPPQSHPDE